MGSRSPRVPGALIRDFRGAWKVACRAAGVPGRVPHDFRRSAIRNMVQRGVPERVAMQLAAHPTRTIFDRYAIVSNADRRRGSLRKAGGLVGRGWGEYPLCKALSSQISLDIYGLR